MGFDELSDPRIRLKSNQTKDLEILFSQKVERVKGS